MQQLNTLHTTRHNTNTQLPPPNPHTINTKTNTTITQLFRHSPTNNIKKQISKQHNNNTQHNTLHSSHKNNTTLPSDPSHHTQENHNLINTLTNKITQTHLYSYNIQHNNTTILYTTTTHTHLLTTPHQSPQSKHNHTQLVSKH